MEAQSANVSHIPQIDNSKTPLQPLNIVHFIYLPTDTPYGNLTLKTMKIVRRIDWMNIEICRVYSTYVHPANEDASDLLQDITEHQHYAEQVIYWMRKTADEIISLAYVLDERKRSNNWPQSIKIDCIGYLSGKQPRSENLTLLFNPHLPFLRNLNSIANAYKHSFINSDMNLVGAQYPVIYALHLKDNKLTSDEGFYSLDFRQVVNDFSDFYKHSMATIRQWGC